IDDLAGLVKALNLALKNDKLRQKLIKNGKITYEKNFSRDNVIATLIGSYKEMISHFKLQQ
ncbi:MAG: glycosyltransferase, partial [Candidatus Puniceispirillaceae bacterium]